MNWRVTGILFALAAGLFVFIWLFDRPDRAPSGAAADRRLVSLAAAEATAVQIKRTNRLMLWVERTNAGWQLTVPLNYPAQPFAVEGFLKRLETLASRTFIPLEEIKANRRTLADFGLEPPQATLSVLGAEGRVDVDFGAKTPPGDGVYVRVAGEEGLHVVDPEIFDALPRSFNEWRDAFVINLAGVPWDRMEVRAPGRGFAIGVDTNTRSFRLIKPTPARADPAKLDVLWRRVLNAQVVRFENDNPRAEMEPYGLHQPTAELAFGRGTNDLFIVQFGQSPTNDSSVIYARRLSHSNVVVASRAMLEALQVSAGELRDLRLLPFAPEQVDEVEVIGPEGFVVQRQTNGAWVVAGPRPFPADPELMRVWLERLNHLEGTVEKDVVTDFASYGLAMPTRQFVLKSGVTNGAGVVVSNRVLAQLDVGGRQAGQFYARSRPLDENLVYTVPAEAIDTLAAGSWMLRDRAVWNFTTNQVQRLTIRQHGYTRQLNRSASGEWSLAPGSQGIINTFGVEECVHRLGQLRAAAWVDRGEDRRERYGITDRSLKLTLELRNGEKPTVLSVEFGSAAPSRYPYALTTVDGEAVIFEFPWDLYTFLQPYLTNPIPTPP
ncbi:MAG TPA: DUF4340 domain-containing protein [Methylomirabilota bacterium]|nr:DUF4340 domain-containing protein [Methylomirabilota bacterium]